MVQTTTSQHKEYLVLCLYYSLTSWVLVVNSGWIVNHARSIYGKRRRASLSGQSFASRMARWSNVFLLSIHGIYVAMNLLQLAWSLQVLATRRPWLLNRAACDVWLASLYFLYVMAFALLFSYYYVRFLVVVGFRAAADWRGTLAKYVILFFGVSQFSITFSMISTHHRGYCYYKRSTLLYVSYACSYLQIVVISTILLWIFLVPIQKRVSHGPGQAPAGTTVVRLEAVIARSRRAVVVSVVSSFLLILAIILEPYIWTYGGEIYEQVLTSFAILNPLRSPASDDVREISGGELVRHRHRHAC